MVMASHLYTTTYSPIPTNKTNTATITTTTNRKTLSFPSQPRTWTTNRRHDFLVQTTAAALSLRKTARLSVSAPAAFAAVQVDVPETSSKPSKSLPFRAGLGFDIHRLEPGYPLIIGGIDVPYDKGCVAHSDGDVLLHCIVDAITGALGLPDIGQMFPDSDPEWKGAPSSIFVKEAMRRMHEAGYEIGNLDTILILQTAKLGPFKEAIKANLSELLGADPSVINLKGKTHEKVDSLGENRSIAAHAVVLLMKK